MMLGAHEWDVCGVMSHSTVFELSTPNPFYCDLHYIGISVDPVTNFEIALLNERVSNALAWASTVFNTDT